MQPSGGYRIKSELTPKERAVEGLIAASATAARWWGTVLRPGTTFAGLIILASGAMSLLKAQDIPDKETWVRGAAANIVLTVTAGAAMVVTFLIVIGYRRLLAANVQRSEFYSACRTVWGRMTRRAISPTGTPFEREATTKRLKRYCSLACQYEQRSADYRKRPDLKANLLRGRQVRDRKAKGQPAKSVVIFA